MSVWDRVSANRQNVVARRGLDGKRCKKITSRSTPWKRNSWFSFLDCPWTWWKLHGACMSTSAKSATTVDLGARVRVKSWTCRKFLAMNSSLAPQSNVMFKWWSHVDIREVKSIHETRRVRVRPTSLVKHSWRVEKRLSHWRQVADECDVKKKARGRLLGSTSKLHATASPPSRGRGCMHKFCLRSLGSLWFRFDDFSRKRIEGARRRSSGRGRLPTCRTAAATHFYWKVHAVAKSTLSKVQIPRCRKGQSPTTLSEVDDVQSPTLSKKKVKIWRESDSIGHASQRPRTRLDECPDPVGSRPAPSTFPDPSPESDSSRFARSLNLPIVRQSRSAIPRDHK